MRNLPIQRGKAELGRIWMERAFHIGCPRCKTQDDTSDASRVWTKEQAARFFEALGWLYVKGTGWLCPTCAETHQNQEKGDLP